MEELVELAPDLLGVGDDGGRLGLREPPHPRHQQLHLGDLADGEGVRVVLVLVLGDLGGGGGLDGDGDGGDGLGVGGGGEGVGTGGLGGDDAAALDEGGEAVDVAEDDGPVHELGEAPVVGAGAAREGEEVLEAHEPGLVGQQPVQLVQLPQLHRHRGQPASNPPPVSRVAEGGEGGTLEPVGVAAEAQELGGVDADEVGAVVAGGGHEPHPVPVLPRQGTVPVEQLLCGLLQSHRIAPTSFRGWDWEGGTRKTS